MVFIDTHTHLYLNQFDNDRRSILTAAKNTGVDAFILPNIDKDSIVPMLQLCADFPLDCFPMMGLHPTSVRAGFEHQLQLIEQNLEQEKYIGVGEIGLDYYWDITYKAEQRAAFRYQLQLAIKHDLPVAIHTRNAFPEILDEVERAQNGKLKGVFHCFGGTADEAGRILDMGMYMGIGGVITYKKSSLPEVVKTIPLSSLLLETDSPFLAPAPFRGKRNESAYLIYIAQKLAEIKGVPVEKVAEVTTSNALHLFRKLKIRDNECIYD
jgi:TatD DNase family protein